MIATILLVSSWLLGYVMAALQALVRVYARLGLTT